MSRFVLDASVTVAWCFKDEANDYTNFVLGYLRNSKALVPSIWSAEVINVMLTGERKKRITSEDVSKFLWALRKFNITEGPSFKTYDIILSLARTHGLTAYDATYLELAFREGVPLATQDKKLQQAAQKTGVALLR